LGYYIRVFGKNPARIPLEKLRADASPAIIEVDQEVGDSWEQLVLKHSSGEEIAVIGRNPVEEGQLGAEELTNLSRMCSSISPSPQLPG